MSVLVHAEVDGDRLDDDSMLHESLLILIGGDETTRHVMSGGMYQLLVHPARWERLRADRALIAPAVEEMLRWVTPIKNMARTVTRDVELHGKTLREGEKLLLLYPSANRDAERFADPDTLRRRPDPQRPRGVRLRHPLLPGELARPTRAARHVRRSCSTGCRTCGSRPMPSRRTGPPTSSAATRRCR